MLEAPVRKRKRTEAPAAAPVGAPEGWGGSVPTAGATAWFDGYVKSNEQLRTYMHEEWGFEKRGDRALFEKLCLEGAQAGLSWATVLAKRAAYRRAFHNFDISACAAMTAADEARLLEPAAAGVAKEDQIVRNRSKVASVPRNARAVLALIATAEASAKGRAPPHGHFDQFVWAFVSGRPQLNRRPMAQKAPAKTAVSEAMSAALKRAGLTFVGPTICYSFMQSCALVIDHPVCTPQWEAARMRLGREEARGKRMKASNSGAK